MEETRSFGYVCPKCGKAVVARRSKFALCGGGGTDRNAQVAGSAALEVQTAACASAVVPCGLCGGVQSGGVQRSGAAGGPWHRPGLPGDEAAVLYAGEEGQVMARTEELAIRVDKERSEQREAFTDNVIMYEVLSELKDMAGRGGVRCTCGSRDYGIRIHRDAVDLTCRACGGRLRLPAATDEDLDQLCCRMTLEIPGRKDGV